MPTSDESSFRSLLDQLTAAANSFEAYSSLDNAPEDRAAFWHGLALVKGVLRRLRGMGQLTLFKDGVDEDARLDSDGCAWYLWTAADLDERRLCDPCGVRCNDGWITDDDVNDATGEPLVRCEDCVMLEDAGDEPPAGTGDQA
jgi:hypothetical protein